MPDNNDKELQAIWDATEALQDNSQMEDGLSAALSILAGATGCSDAFCGCATRRTGICM